MLKTSRCCSSSGSSWRARWRSSPVSCSWTRSAPASWSPRSSSSSRSSRPCVTGSRPSSSSSTSWTSSPSAATGSRCWTSASSSPTARCRRCWPSRRWSPATWAPGARRSCRASRRTRSRRTPLRSSRLDHVSTGYGHFKALNDISFDVHHGEVVALLGTNGAGKTTAARVISGMIPATAGRITLDGRDITSLASHDVARLGLAHCMEGRHIFADLTVHENLVLAGVGQEGRHAGPARRGSTTCSTCWPSAATSRASSSQAASSRCWPSAAL